MQPVELVSANEDLANLPNEDATPVLVSQRPIRVLHIVGGMNRGGAETWLINVLRSIDRKQFRMDFLVHTNQACAYDDEIRTLGSKIIPCLSPSKPWLYARNFRQILQKHEPYDIVHSHVHHFSGFVLWLAKQGGVPVRIAHSHLDSSPLEAEAGWLRHLYLAGMKALITRNATFGLGCSHIANLDLFDFKYKTNLHSKILYCGIDLTSFRGAVDSSGIQTKLGIPNHAFVIGHVGRFQEQKNHQFLLKVFAEIIKREPQSYLLLIGEGPLQASIEQQASNMGLRNRIIFAGSQSDVPRLILGTTDIVLFPSLCEGLPLVLIEAQAAGLPCIISDAISEETDVIHPLIKRLSLLQPASVWADESLLARKIKASVKQQDCLHILEKSKFNITCSVKALIDIYANEYRQS